MQLANCVMVHQRRFFRVYCCNNTPLDNTALRGIDKHYSKPTDRTVFRVGSTAIKNIHEAWTKVRPSGLLLRSRRQIQVRLRLPSCCLNVNVTTYPLNFCASVKTTDSKLCMNAKPHETICSSELLKFPKVCVNTMAEARTY